MACKDPDVSDECVSGIVMSGLICPSFIVTIFAPLATQFYCFPVSVCCLRIVSSRVRQDMTTLLRAFFFPFSMRSSSRQKPCLVPRKQWRRETGFRTGRVRYDWSFDIRVLRQHKVSFEALLVVESKYEAL